MSARSTRFVLGRIPQEVKNRKNRKQFFIIANLSILVGIRLRFILLSIGLLFRKKQTGEWQDEVLLIEDNAACFFDKGALTKNFNHGG